MPNAIEPCTWRSLPAYRLHHPDFGTVIITHRGAQVVSWCTADGRERLYVSPTAQCAEGAPIRGGVPICFPQFSGRGALPQHGIVRTRDWLLDDSTQDSNAITLMLGDDAASRALWPHAFHLALTVHLQADSLQLALTVRNTGDTAWSFMAALHTYLRVETLPAWRIEGLPAGTCFDNLDRAERVFAGGAVSLAQPVDQVHAGIQAPLLLTDGTQPLQIAQQGFADAVLWNPGAERARAIADLPDDDWNQFICVEAGQINASPVLAPGGEWRGSQTISVLR